MKIIVHNGKLEKEWTYEYIPGIGEEVISKVATFKVVRKGYVPQDNTLHLYFKKIADKQQKSASKDIDALYEEQRDFLIKEIEPFLPEYKKEICQPFYEYWTEKIVKGIMKGQCRYAAEKTWSIKKRLNTWKSNNFNK